MSRALQCFISHYVRLCPARLISAYHTTSELATTVFTGLVLKSKSHEEILTLNENRTLASPQARGSNINVKFG